MRKKVVIILPKLTAGGTERSAVELANSMVEKNYEVHLLLMYTLPHFFETDNRIIIHEPDRKVRMNCGRFLYVPLLLLFLRIKLKKIEPDTVFCLGYILFGLMASWNLKTKVIISGRSSPNRVRFPGNGIANKMYAGFHKIVSRRVNGVIAQTSLAQNVYAKRYSCPIVVIPNFLRDVKRYPDHKKGKIIINVGRLVNEKGQHFLLKAFAKLDRQDWKLWLVGDGPLRGELENLAGVLRISEQVVFLGFQKDVDYYLSQASIFAFSSVIEGYPNALIEGMAHGLAPVSYNCEAGPADIINHNENGFLVETGNINDFKQYLNILINDIDTRHKFQLNASKILDDNNKTKITDRYIDFLMS